MEKPELKDSVCCNLRSVTQSIKGGVPLNRLERDYQDLIGSSIPYRKLGYNSLESFIQGIPSVIRLTKGRDGYLMAEAVADTSTAHIANLISRQKQTSKAKATKRFSSRRGGFASKDAYKGERNSCLSFLRAVKSSGRSYKQDFKPSQGYYSRPQNTTPSLNFKIEIKDTNHIPVDKTPALTTTKPLPVPPTAELPSPAANKPKLRATSMTRGYEIAPRFQRLLQQKMEAIKAERCCSQESCSSSNFFTARSSLTPPQTPSQNPNPYAFTASSIASGNSPSITSPIDDMFIPPPAERPSLLPFTASSIPSANSSSRTSTTDDTFIPPPVERPSLLPFTASSIPSANSSSSIILPTDDIFIPPPAERPSLLLFTPSSITQTNFSSYRTSPTDDIFIPPPTEALISAPIQTSYSPVKMGSNGFANNRARRSFQLRASMNAETFSQQLESAQFSKESVEIHARINNLTLNYSELGVEEIATEKAVKEIQESLENGVPARSVVVCHDNSLKIRICR